MDTSTIPTTVYIGADHRGFDLKSRLLSWLIHKGYKTVDLGNTVYDESDDYPDVAANVATKVAAESRAKGILLCGSGIGVTVAANKIRGARAGLGFDEAEVKHGRQSDDINILTLSAGSLTEQGAQQLIKVFLETEFSGEPRHVRRLAKIAELEKVV